MKNKLFLIFILILTGFNNLNAQDSLKFTLPIPSKNEIAIFKKSSNEIGYDYLKDYFKIEGKRVDIAKSEMPGDNSICDWKQKFSNGIYYHFNNFLVVFSRVPLVFLILVLDWGCGGIIYFIFSFGIN